MRNTTRAAITALESQLDSLTRLADQLERQITGLHDTLEELRAQAAADPAPEPVNRLVSVRQAAEYLSISRSTMYALIADSQVTTVRVGSTTKVRTGDLDAYAERHVVVRARGVQAA